MDGAADPRKLSRLKRQKELWGSMGMMRSNKTDLNARILPQHMVPVYRFCHQPGPGESSRRATTAKIHHCAVRVYLV